MADDLNVSFVLRLVDRITGPIKPALRQIEGLKRQLSGVADAGRMAGRGIGKIGDGLKTGAGILTGYGAAMALAASQLIAPAAQFEKFQTILETTEGSAEKAKEAMDWVTQFAVKTPFELDQVMAAFVQLRAYGLDPTTGLLSDLGDTASAMNKDVLQAVEAIADAVTGENERLKEFGIKASKEGSKYAYAYTVDGVRKVIKASAEDPAAIEAALREIFRERFAGAMERQSLTWEGMMSNLSDLWSGFQRMIMGAGLFDWMKGELQNVLAIATQMQADGTLQLWATEIGNSIKEALIVMRELLVGVLDVAKEAGPWLQMAADKLGGWNELAIALLALPFAGMFVSIVQGIVMVSAALLTNPILASIAAIGLAVYAIYDNWDGIVAYFQAKLDAVYAAFDDGFLKGILALMVAFSPVTIFMDAFKGLVEWLTGYSLDFRWSDILPDWNWSDIIPDLPDFGLFDNAGTTSPGRGGLRNQLAVDRGASPLTTGAASTAGVTEVTNVGGITVNAAPGMNEEALAQRVAEKIERRRPRGRGPVRRMHDDDGFGGTE